MKVYQLIFGGTTKRRRSLKDNLERSSKPAKSKAQFIGNLDLKTSQTFLIDYKYHLVKIVLIRSIYHNYLKANTLVGDLMQDILKLTEITICLNRGIVYLDKSDEGETSAITKKRYMVKELGAKY